MKMIIAIVRPEKYEDVKNKLRDEGITGMTITHVSGRGKQAGVKFTGRVGEFTVDELDKIKLEVILEDQDTEKAIDIIRSSAWTGHHGDGKIFVVPVEEAYTISDYSPSK